MCFGIYFFHDKNLMHCRETRAELSLRKEGDLCDNYKLDSVDEYLSASYWPQSCVVAHKISYATMGADAFFLTSLIFR